MKGLKNILSVIGGLVVIGVLYALLTSGDMISKVKKLDPNAMGLYMDMAERVLNEGDAAATMVKTIPAEDGVSIEDMIDSMKSVAEENNMLMVGKTVMFNNSASGDKDTFGNPTRSVVIVSFCNKQIARKFIDYSVAYGAFMPCRVLITEDKDGKLWLSTMKLDLMIAGGYSLTPEMLKLATKIKDTMYLIQEKAAAGDF